MSGRVCGLFRASWPGACFVRLVRPAVRVALEGKGPQKRSQRRLDRRLEEVAKAVGGGYCRLQMHLSLTLAARATVAGHRLGAWEGGGGGLPPFQCIPARSVGEDGNE